MHNICRARTAIVCLLLLLPLSGCALSSISANCVSGDCVNGQGTVLGFGGWSYSGSFQAGQGHGKGTFTWSDGTRFEGTFDGGRRVGPGILTRTNGQIVRGVWNDVKGVGYLSPEEFNANPPALEGYGLSTQQALTPATQPQQLPVAPAAPAPDHAMRPKPATAKPQAAPNTAQSRRVALVIGNGAYKQGPLKNPVNDARDMAATLRQLGFEVILRENASLAIMEQAVEEFWAQLRRGGAGLFYFAGHGLQVNGRNYLVPVDAKLSAEQDARYRCMDAGLVLGRMENAGNDLNLVILDACRNNPFSRSWRSGSEGLAKMDAPKGSIIAYATAPDSVAADGDGRNGVYTEKLLKAMRVPGQPVELVFKRVRDEVMRATSDKQVPWESTSLRGDFYFTMP